MQTLGIHFLELLPPVRIQTGFCAAGQAGDTHMKLCWSTPVLEIKQTKYLPLSAFFCKLGTGDMRQGNELTVVSCYWANGRRRFRNQSPSFLMFLTEIIAMVGAVTQWHMQEKLIFIFCCLRGKVLHTASVVLFVQGHLHLCCNVTS